MIHLFTGRYSPVFYLLFLLLLLSISITSFAKNSKQIINLEVNNYAIHAEVAADEDTRAQGLMFRERLAPDSGMLFVFEQPAKPCFWMKNTPLDLSIAFITDQGIITNIELMQAHQLDTHCPTEPVRYALEMEQGWFHNKAQAGDQIHGLTH